MSTQTQPAPPPAAVPVRFRNASQWWDALGNVPLERIVFDPPPGTATEADLLRLDDHEDRLCELIDGTLVEKVMGFDESGIAARIIYFLMAYVQPRRLGIVTAPDGMMRILERRVRIPDVAFISRDRMQDADRSRGRIPAIAPDLAVEVLSEGNSRREMAIKLQEYFAAGTRLVWYVDPKTRTIDVYTSPDGPRRLNENDTLTGGDVLPGFEVKVSEIFETGLEQD